MLGFLTFLASPLGRIVGYGAVALVLVATLFAAKAEWDAGRAAIKQVHHIAAVSEHQTAAVAKADKATAAADVKAQTKIVTRYRTITKEITRYVSTSPSPPTGCITWGMLKLYDAPIIGVDPSALQAPAGAPDYACSTVSPAVFMAGVNANNQAATQNAQQLNDLIADALARDKGVTPTTTPATAASAGNSPAL